MKNILKYGAITGFIALSLAPLTAVAEEVNAGVSATVNVSASTTRQEKQQDRIDNAKGRGDDAIQKRLGSLSALIARVSDMKRLTADEIASIKASIQTEIDALETLRTKISTDTDAATLKDDLRSVAKDHRVYALILPQKAVIAAAERILTVVGKMENLSVKLSARIDAAAAAGADVSSLTTVLADFDAKVADAKAQANAAIAEVEGLTPDNGDQAKFQANLAALKDARSKIQAARQDLVAAYQDAKTIAQAVRGRGNATSTTP